MVDRNDAVIRLSEHIPRLNSLSPNQDIEVQARTVLRYLIDPLFTGREVPLQPVAIDPKNCPNCDSPASSRRTPYCSSECQEISAFVRQLRSGLRDQSIFDDGRLVAFGQTLWFLLGGGRPLRQSLVSLKDREKVWKREGGKCQVCGKAATTIDHDKTGCNRTINLRAVCDSCSKTRPFGDPSVTKTPEFEIKLLEFVQRVGNPVAIRICDDSETWNWREYLSKR